MHSSDKQIHLALVGTGESYQKGSRQKKKHAQFRVELCTYRNRKKAKLNKKPKVRHITGKRNI